MNRLDALGELAMSRSPSPSFRARSSPWGAVATRPFGPLSMRSPSTRSLPMFPPARLSLSRTTRSIPGDSSRRKLAADSPVIPPPRMATATLTRFHGIRGKIEARSVPSRADRPRGRLRRGLRRGRSHGLHVDQVPDDRGDLRVAPGLEHDAIDGIPAAEEGRHVRPGHEVLGLRDPVVEPRGAKPLGGMPEVGPPLHLVPGIADGPGLPGEAVLRPALRGLAIGEARPVDEGAARLLPHDVVLVLGDRERELRVVELHVRARSGADHGNRRQARARGVARVALVPDLVADGSSEDGLPLQGEVMVVAIGVEGLDGVREAGVGPEPPDDGPRLVLGQVEGRHPHAEPRPERLHVEEESEEPVPAHALALADERRRRLRPLHGPAPEVVPDPALLVAAHGEHARVLGDVLEVEVAQEALLAVLVHEAGRGLDDREREVPVDDPAIEERALRKGDRHHGSRLRRVLRIEGDLPRLQRHILPEPGLLLELVAALRLVGSVVVEAQAVPRELRELDELRLRADPVAALAIELRDEAASLLEGLLGFRVPVGLLERDPVLHERGEEGDRGIDELLVLDEGEERHLEELLRGLRDEPVRRVVLVDVLRDLLLVRDHVEAPGVGELRARPGVPRMIDGLAAAVLVAPVAVVELRRFLDPPALELGADGLRPVEGPDDDPLPAALLDLLPRVDVADAHVAAEAAVAPYEAMAHELELRLGRHRLDFREGLVPRLVRADIASPVIERELVEDA